jgi:endonuclease YncB( thermonuclease family)
MKQKPIYAALIAAFFYSAVAQTITGDVIGIADGDTITILEAQNGIKTPRKIRIGGIDAPEKSQAFGTASKQALSDLAYKRSATAECRDTDRYGRSICVVRVNGVDIGLRQIETGMAWHYRKYASTQPREEAAAYSLSEELARSKGAGLWRDVASAAPPIPPWEWRTR